MKRKILGIIRMLYILMVLSISVIFVKVTKDLNIIPGKYYYTGVVILFILNILTIVCLFMRKTWKKIIGFIISLIVIVISIIGLNYCYETNKFLDNSFDNNNMEVTKYDVVVLKDSKYKKLKELDDKTMAYLTSDENSSKVVAIIKNKVSSKLVKYDNVYDLYEDLIDSKLESILLDEAYLDVLKEEYTDLDDKIKVVDSFVIESFIKKNKELVVDEKLEPINIYISGSDSRSGEISDKSRSDVNMIMTINPKTRTILLTSIPRDYYVQLHGTKGNKDKLTHSGLYGIDMSKETVEDLLDIEIDYTIKVGFSSVIEIVNLIGGIDIESDRDLTTSCGDGGAKKVKVVKGINHFDGGEALSYARERYAYKSGDRHRIQNQQQVLEAIINKVLSRKDILLKYSKYLDAFSKLYKTDIPDKLIRNYIKLQLNDMSSWKIEKQYVDGTGEKKETYSMPGRKLYVMVPDEDSVNKSKENINKVLKGEK